MTKQNLHKGKTGEDLAAAFLIQKGWRIAERNWRHGHGEIDIIAWTPDHTLVFVEVKTRKDESFGGPEGAMHFRKRQKLIKTAAHYMESIDYEWIVRFDLVAIILNGENVEEIRHWEDAFFLS